MFKFFRQYNKVILVVGGCVLMVAFLVPQAVQMFGPNPAKEGIGTAHGEKLTRGDSRQAAAELQLLEGLPFRDGLITDDPLAWLLIQKDAAAMGLYASNQEVEVALQGFGYDEETLLQIAENVGTTSGTIRELVRRWLVSEQYRQLVTGTAYRDPRGNSSSLALERMGVMSRQIQVQLQQYPPEYQQAFAPQIVQVAAVIANGTHRISSPLLEKYIQDNYTTVEGRVVLVTPDLDNAPEPSEAQVAEVFAQYKDALPGRGEPFAFGYRYPDRVKLEYLRLPMDRVREAVEVEYLDVLDAYRDNQPRFATDAGPAPEMPTPEAVEALTEELRDRKAEQLAARIMAQVQSLLAEDVRGYAQEDGYVVLTDGFTPMPWSEITSAVQQEHGVRLDVMGDPETWVPIAELQTLEGIGGARFGDGVGISLTEYLARTRKLLEEGQNVPRSQQTQVGVAGKPLRGFDGNLYVFRLLDAQKSRSPETLDEVRDFVVADAKTVAAYEKLVADAEAWRTTTVNEGLDAAAEAADTSPVATFEFQKARGTEGEAPNVLGVGASRQFVDSAFALVEERDDVPADVTELPLEQRVAVTPLPKSETGPALAVFVLEDFAPLTRSTYDQAVEGIALYEANSAIDRAVERSPLSLEAIAERVGFDLEDAEN